MGDGVSTSRGTGDGRFVLAGTAYACLSTIAVLVALLVAGAVLSALTTPGAPHDSDVPELWLTFVVGLVVYEGVLQFGKPAVLLAMTGAGDVGYGQLLSARVRARLVAAGFSAVGTPVVVAVALVTTTAVPAALYATTTVQPPAPVYYVVGVAVLFLVCWTVGLAPVSFAGVLAVEGVSPRRAWLASARIARANPWATVVDAVTRFSCALAPVVAAASFILWRAPDGVWELLGPAAVFLAVALVTRTAELVVHDHVFAGLDRVDAHSKSLRTVLGEARRRLTGGTALRVTLVAVLVVGLVVTAGAVRVGVVGPTPGPAEPAMAGTDDPDALYETAHGRSLAGSYNLTSTTHAGDWDGDRAPVFRTQVIIDRSSRALGATGWVGDDDGGLERSARLYADDGIQISQGVDTDLDFAITRAIAGPDGWSVVAAPAYTQRVRDLTAVPVPRTGVDWTVNTATDSTVELETRDTDALLATTEEDPDRLRYDDGFIRVTVDPATERLDRIVVFERLARLDADGEVTDRIERETAYRFEYDDVTVERPDAGSRLTGLVWTLLYY